jgi:hypothetical protein
MELGCDEQVTTTYPTCWPKLGSTISIVCCKIKRFTKQTI